jgi:phosphoglycolate phosphatase-like HAD superfamily hydrolase
MKYHAVLWDWDGTLFNSDYEVWRADNLALAQHGFPTRTYDVFRHRAANCLVPALGGEVAQDIVDSVRSASWSTALQMSLRTFKSASFLAVS